MTESGNDRQTPPISGPSPEEVAHTSGIVPEVEGYEIAGPLGEGGMGTVWSAVQLSTRREVAIKLLGKGAFGSERDRARFEREVELTARLHHPNIAQVFDSGVHRGVYYYAMELIEGAPLDKHVESQQLTRRQILELMRAVCQAVQHAHERGVIHRDLKPSNILVTPDGQPHVLDFGLAKTFLQGDWVLTETTYGEAAGTPAYMSPEQAAGKLDQIDVRTDVYALGVILFRLLTTQSPHDLSGTRYEVLRRIAEEEVRRPRDITKEVDRELEALLLKALARDPKARYASAGSLAQDLENYLNGEPLAARPPTTAYFLRKRIRKYRLRVAIASSVLVALIGTGVFAYIRVSQERTRAVAAETMALDRLGTLQREADKANAVNEWMRQAITLLDPQMRWGTFPEQRDRIAREIAAKFSHPLEVEAAIRMAMGNAYFFSGQVEVAQKEFSRALEIFRSVLSEGHRDTLLSMEILAAILWHKGALDKAEAANREILEIRRQALDEKHRDTLLSMYTLARTLWRSGKLDEAEATLRQCLGIQQRELGPEDMDTLSSMKELAILLEEKGELHEAELILKQCLEIQRSVLGADHIGTRFTLKWLGFVLEQEGKLDELEALHRELLDIERRLYGDEDPSTLGNMNRLAAVLWGKGRLDEVEHLNRQILEIRKRIRSEDDLNTLWAMSNLAEVLEANGKLSEAERLRKESGDIRKDILAKKLPEILEARELFGVPVPHEPTVITDGETNRLAYDGFYGKLSLDWKIVHPDPPRVALSKRPGTLTITTQNASTGLKNLLLIDCPTASGGDFQITTCLSSFKPLASCNQAGLIFYNGDDNHLKFVCQLTMGYIGPLLVADADAGPGLSGIVLRAPWKSERVWLRVMKRGNRYAFSVSLDGKTFFQTRRPKLDNTGLYQGAVMWGDGSVRQVGLIAGNGPGTMAPEIDASFDFFEVRSVPADATAGGEVASTAETESDVQTP